MINDLSNKARKKMDDIMSFLKKDLDSISTGRANPSLLDAVRVEAYGSFMPISQVANVSTPDASTILVQAWDKSMVKPIEKGIVNSNLGFNPMIDGQTLRITIPKLSEERRRDLVKLAKKYGEDKKVAVRNSRRDILDDFKKQEKELGISKDDAHSFADIVQKITDEYVKKIDDAVLAKEKELMKI
ncbi:MAG: ribosome recycling factor [Rickettsiaceae bacterium]|jgi:ribosome recycling factor|nr:ribosome recycling factor [Rickettsiaceae bacterium]